MLRQIDGTDIIKKVILIMTPSIFNEALVE